MYARPKVTYLDHDRKHANLPCKLFWDAIIYFIFKRAESLPRYVTCRSRHSAGKTSLFTANLLAGGRADFWSCMLLYLIESWFLVSGGVWSLPSRNTLVPMSAKPLANRPSLANTASKDSIWGFTSLLQEWIGGMIGGRVPKEVLAAQCMILVIPAGASWLRAIATAAGWIGTVRVAMQTAQFAALSENAAGTK